MEIRELVERAFRRDLSDPSALNDAFDSLRLLEPEDFKLAHERNKRNTSAFGQICQRAEQLQDV